MEFALLGTLEARAENGPLPLGPQKQRAVLALLLLHANRVVSRDRLIDDLWGEAPPDTAVKALQGYVSKLRRLLPEGTLLTRPPGYVLEVEPEAVDLRRFERLVAEAKTAEPSGASRLLGEALALWRGPPLAEFDEEPFAQVEAPRLEDLKLATLMDRIDAELTLGRHTEVTRELEALVAEHPHRERLHGQLILALYRSGRQADALAAYRDARIALDELGLEPGTELRQLERQILTQDAALEPGRGRLLATESVALPGALVPTPPFPFVGRARELTMLRELLERAEHGEGALALLAAEAGGGKTRLVRELAHEAAGRGVLVLHGASDAAVSVPYQPLREWLEFLVRVCDPGALAEFAADSSGILARLVPGLAAATGSPPAGDPESDRYLLQSAASDLLGRISARQPLLVVAEDAHWADGETLQLLRRLARSAPEARMLVLVTYRDRGEEATPAFADALADLSRVDGVVRVALERLGDDDVSAFVVASADAQPSSELASTLGALTGGTPLLLCELWRDLHDSGGLEVTGARVELTRPVAELRGPERLRDLVRQRLSRLDADTAAMLELAAVCGPRFELSVLAEALSAERRAVAGLVADAVSNGLIEELPEPLPAARFTHELVRRAVYDRIAGLHRAELHLRVGEALERAHAADLARVLPELAHHFTLAAPAAGVERAVDYSLRDAEASAAAAAYELAAAALSTALELGIADPRDRARARIELAYLLSDAGRFADSETVMGTSLEAPTGPEERRVAAHALLRRLGDRGYEPDANPQADRAVIEQLIRTFTELGDVPGLAEAELGLGAALRREGHWGEAAVALERAVLHAESSGSATLRRRTIGSLAFVLGDGPMPVGDALRRCEELRTGSRGDRTLEAVVTRVVGALHAMAGRADEAREHIRRSSLVLDELDIVTVTWAHRWIVAEARDLVGDRAGAEHELFETWRKFRDLGGDVPDLRAMGAGYRLALFCCDDGRWDDAEHWLEYGREVPLPPYFRRDAVFRLAAGARIAAHRGEPADAARLARGAVDNAERGDLLNVTGLAWLSLADVQRHGGAVAEADAALATAIALFERKGNVAATRRAMGEEAPEAAPSPRT